MNMHTFRSHNWYQGRRWRNDDKGNDDVDRDSRCMQTLWQCEARSERTEWEQKSRSSCIAIAARHKPPRCEINNFVCRLLCDFTSLRCGFCLFVSASFSCIRCVRACVCVCVSLRSGIRSRDDNVDKQNVIFLLKQNETDRLLNSKCRRVSVRYRSRQCRPRNKHVHSLSVRQCDVISVKKNKK